MKDFCMRDIFAERFPGDRHGIKVQERLDAAHQRRQTARVKEIFHEIFVAGWSDIGDDRHFPAGTFEIIEADVLAGAARHGNEMNDRIGRTAHRHRHGNGVFDRLYGSGSGPA